MSALELIRNLELYIVLRVLHHLIIPLNKTAKSIIKPTISDISTDASICSKWIMINDQPPSNSIIDDNQKKMIHRDIERKRRQDMATLYSSLRSALPAQSTKGKRSLADHMNEAVNYIKHMQTRIRELSLRRDNLKVGRSLLDLSTTSVVGLDGNLSGSIASSSSLAQNQSRSRVAVNPCLNGVEIVISCATSASSEQHGVTLSRLLQVLLEQGLDVTNCAMTKVNTRLVYTIQSEVSNQSCVDFPGLEQTLTKVISSST